jgi:hypothetical protein
MSWVLAQVEGRYSSLIIPTQESLSGLDSPEVPAGGLLCVKLALQPAPEAITRSGAKEEGEREGKGELEIEKVGRNELERALQSVKSGAEARDILVKEIARLLTCLKPSGQHERSSWCPQVPSFHF